MNVKWKELWRWGGTIDRRSYLMIGTLLFGLKYLIDRTVATRLFGREWTPFQYAVPGSTLRALLTLKPEDRAFFATMAALSVPFIWIGVGLTLKRLRDTRLPLWLVVCFFLPLPL